MMLEIAPRAAVRTLASLLLGLAACGGSKSTPSTPAPVTGTYAVCAGQGAAEASPARVGEMNAQLAPAFLDQMAACAPADVAPSVGVTGDAGAVNAKGDCAWPSGVSCHYHLGVEFVASGEPRPAMGELHCIFPSTDDAKSPEVFGGHFTCAGQDPAAPATPGAHEVHEGAACGGGLLPALAAALSSCSGVQCCDDGTLTSPTAERQAAGTLDVRPDFHICRGAMELDCAALAAMTGHAANAPVYGPPIEDGFALPAAH
ncbi:MAG: hypothetical protein K8W52_08585 [Deltaproteobacteria bacterium]|nr:hypothetical protein [Deltaproteobacteria bacterium]